MFTKIAVFFQQVHDIFLRLIDEICVFFSCSQLIAKIYIFSYDHFRFFPWTFVKFTFAPAMGCQNLQFISTTVCWSLWYFSTIKRKVHYVLPQSFDKIFNVFPWPFDKICYILSSIIYWKLFFFLPSFLKKFAILFSKKLAKFAMCFHILLMTFDIFFLSLFHENIDFFPWSFIEFSDSFPHHLSKFLFVPW